MIDVNLHRNAPNYPVLDCDQRPYDPDKPTIKQILWYNLDWSEDMEAKGLFTRPAIMDNITKTLLCKTFYLGYDLFVCPVCDNENIITHKCHSRFCNSCGVKQQKLVAVNVAEMAVDAQHRHIVFTIPEELRNWFRKDRDALNFLFIAARNTIALICNKKLFKKMKKENRKGTTYLFQNYAHQLEFGMIACLHTFGRDLKWSPHLHVLVPELIYDPEKGITKPFNHFPFEQLRKTFQFELLRLMNEHFSSKEFKQLTNRIYSTKKNGFYVYARYGHYDVSETKGISIDHVKGVKGKVDYIMRYASRPAMAESRLISYNTETNTVKWFYDRHEDDVRVEVEESGIDFLKRLIIHIPNNGFQLIRYYGFYNNRKKDSLEKIYELLSQEHRTAHLTIKARKRKAAMKATKYRCRTFIMDSYNRDILLCPCGTIMAYADTYDPLEGISNDDRYRRDCINEMREMWLHRRSAGMGPPGTQRNVA